MHDSPPPEKIISELIAAFERFVLLPTVPHRQQVLDVSRVLAHDLKAKRWRRERVITTIRAAARAANVDGQGAYLIDHAVQEGIQQYDR